MPLYATQPQADADAASLRITDHVGTVPVVLLRHIATVARNPRSNSDTLLITADALREAAAPLGTHAFARALRDLANTLAGMAPARIDPIGAAE